MGLSALQSIVLVVLIPLVGVPTLILCVRLLNALVRCLFKERGGDRDVPRESLRKRMALVMSSRTGTFWLIFQVFISLLGVLLYVVEIYTQPMALFVFETGLSVFFAIDYIIFFYIAKDKLKYFFSFFSLVDLLAIYPYFVAWFILLGASDVLAILLVLRSLRIVRVYRVLSFFSYSNISRQLAVVLLTIFSLIFVAAATMHFIETYHDDSVDNIFYDFHNVLYFIVVAFATVGFGDITPATTAGRMAMMLFIMIAAVLIPIQTIKLINLVNSHSPFMGSYQRDKRTMHMVVTGSITFSAVIDLIREIFHKYQRYRHCNLVVLSPEEPSEEMRTLIYHPYFTTRITYLKGSPLASEDLQRAQLRDAVACFVLAPKSYQDSKRADTETIMLNLALKDFAPELPTCIQLTKQSNKYLASGTKNTSIVTLDDIKMSILAKGCIVPGFATLITNLVRSYSPEDYSLSQTSWQQEYHYGSAHEIYETELPNFFDGTTFTEAAKVLYAQYHVCLLAVETLVRVTQPTSPRESRASSSEDEYSERKAIVVDDSHTTVVQRILLNPASEHRISAGCRAFIIALNPQLSKAVQQLESVVTSSLKLEELSRTFSLQPGVHLTPVRRTKSTRNPYEFARGGGRGWNATIGTPLAQIEPEEEDDEHDNMRCSDLLASGADVGAWNEIYHILPDPVEFRSHAFITERSPIALQGHVVVIGTTEGLEYFILPLRSKRLPQLRPIVILHPQPPSEEIWSIIGRFPEVYFVQGSGLIIADLRRCNVRRASNVVLFTNPSQLAERTHLMDADTLLTYRLITQHFPRTGTSITIAEMTHSTHIKYIEPGLCKFNEEKKVNFASVPEQLLLGITNHEELLHSEHHFNPLFAAGHVYTLSMLDSIMSQVLNRSSSNNNSVLQLISLLACGAESVEQSYESSELALLPLPQAFANQLYGQLFTYLADQDVIPIGLYRCADAKLSTRPFVFTNPPPATLLHKGDFVFVLPPPQSELSLDPDTLNYLFCVPEPTRMPSSDDAAAAVAAGGGPAPSSLTINSSMSTTSSSINSVESTNDSGVEITIEIAPEKRE